MTVELPRHPPHRTLLQRLRSWFFTGLVVFGPLGLTVYVGWWLISLIDNWVKPLAPSVLWPDNYLPVHVPGFGVIVAIAGITLLGFLAANIAGRSWSASGEAMLDRTPVLRSVYKSLKQIFETIFREGGTQFRKVGLVEYPAKGQWSIVFIVLRAAARHRRGAWRPIP